MIHELLSAFRRLCSALVGLAFAAGALDAQPTMRFSASTITAGYPASLLLDLGTPAPAGGLPLTLSSSAPSVVRFTRSGSGELDVVVPGGVRTLSVPLSTAGVAATTKVSVAASGKLTLTANAAVAPLRPASVTLNAVAGFAVQDMVTATIRLGAPAPVGGLRLMLLGSSDGLAGQQFTVAGGATEAVASLRTPNLPRYELVSFGVASGDLDVEAARRLVRASPAPQSAALHVYPVPVVQSVTPLVPTTLVQTRVPVRITFAPVAIPVGAPLPASAFGFLLSGHTSEHLEQRERYTPGQTEMTAQYDVGPLPTIIFPRTSTVVSVAATERIQVLLPSIRLTALQSTRDTVAVGDSAVFTITLAEPAPRGTPPIAVRVNTGTMRLPPSISVAEGARTVSFVGRATEPVIEFMRLSAPQQTAGGRRNSDGSVTIVSESVARITDSLRILAVPRPALQSLRPVPATLSAGQSGVIEVQFARQDLSWVRVPLPAHTFTLVSSNPTLIGGRDVQVNAGTSSVLVPIVAGTPTSETRVAFTAAVDGRPVNGSTSLLVTPPLPRVTAIRAARTTVAPGDSVPVTVSFDRPAPTGGLTVLLTSSVPLALAVPSSVSASAGASTVSFVARAQPTVTTATTVSITTPPSPQPGSITTVVDGTSNTVLVSETVSTGTISIVPQRVTEVAFAPNPVFGGLGGSELTVRLASDVTTPQPVALRLTVSAGAAASPCTIPASVTVPAGSREVRQRIETTRLSTDGSITCTVAAELAERPFSATSLIGGLAVHPIPAIVDIAPAPADMVGGGALSGQVRFTTTNTLNLRSTTAATTPLIITTDNVAVRGQTVSVPAGATGVSYVLGTSPVASPTPVRVTYTLADVVTTRTFTLLPPPPRLVSFTLDRTTVIGGDTVTATVSLDRPVVTAPFTVGFLTSSSSVGLPASVDIPVGASQATVRIATARVSQGLAATMAATERAPTSIPLTDGSVRTISGSTGISASLTVVPLSVQQLLVDQPVLFGGVQRPNATIMLPARAPSAGAKIVLTSSVPGVLVGSVRLPAVFTVPGGADRRTLAFSTQQTPQLSDMTLIAHPAPEGSVDGAFAGTLDAASPLARAVPMQLLPIPILGNVRVDPASVIGGNAVAILGDLTNSVRPTLVTANPPTLNLVVGSDRQDILASGTVVVRPGDTTVRLDRPTTATTTDVTVRLTLTLVITRLGASLLVRHP